MDSRSLPETVKVEIEVALGGLIKWGSDGGIDFVSPVPCPFNYGAVTGVAGGDGDPLDAVVLGRRLPRGHVGFWPVQGVIRFEDAGLVDDKLICGARPLRNREKLALLAFFSVYGACKRLLNRFRDVEGPTGVRGYTWR
jgi:inorganic pyrophosphatase